MKKIFSILLVLACLGALLTACAEATEAAEETDGLRFKKEYEILNGQYTLDGAHQYAELTIPEENPFVYASIEDITALLTDGSGAIYFGFPECPWCRTLLPVLVEAAEAAGYEGNIYYYNALSDRDSRYLDDNGEIVVEQEGTENYETIMSLLGEYFWEYQGLNDPTIKRLYFPTMVFVRDGEVQSVHIDTIEGQESGYDPLTEEQHDALLGILTDGLNSTVGTEE